MPGYPRTDLEVSELRGAVRVCVEQSVAPEGSPLLHHNPPSRKEFTREGMLVGNRSEVPFTWDETGRKIRVLVSLPEDYRNRSMGGSPFSLADRRPNLPDGGTATTYFDERDRPIEALVRNSQNELVASAVRSYDELGRIAEEYYIMHTPGAYFPPDLLSSIAASEHLKSLLSRRIHSIQYFYDSGDKPIRTVHRDPNRVLDVVTSYNDHGDVQFEKAMTTATADAEVDPRLPSFSYSEMRYSYQYDQAGNWTEKEIWGRTGTEDPFMHTLTWRRTIEYF